MRISTTVITLEWDKTDMLYDRLYIRQSFFLNLIIFVLVFFFSFRSVFFSTNVQAVKSPRRRQTLKMSKFELSRK